MTIITKWDNSDQNVIRVTFSPAWTWDDVREMNTQIDMMLGSVEHQVFFLVDVRATSMIPSGLSLDVVRNTIVFSQPNADLLISVGMISRLRKVLNSMLQAIGPIKTQIKFVDTIDEGYSAIQYRLLEIERSQL